MKKTFKLIILVAVVMFVLSIIMIYIGGANLYRLFLGCIIAAILIVGIVKLLSKD